MGGGFGQRLDGCFGVGDDLVIFLHLSEFDQFDVVGEVLFDFRMRVHRIDQHLPVAHQLLRGLWIIPQVGVLDPRVELFKPVLGRLDIEPLGQQSHRLFNLFDDVLNLGAHVQPLLAAPWDSSCRTGRQDQLVHGNQ